MALPVVKHPTYTVSLKNHGEVKFRNYINKEHKALLQATELGDESSIFDTTIDIVNSCADIDAKSLTESELEFLFLQIYVKSVQNKIEGNYHCEHIVDKEIVSENDVTGEEEKHIVTEPCGSEFKIVIPIENADIVYPKNYDKNSIVQINDEIKIKLKEPTVQEKHELQKLSISDDKEVADDIDVLYIFKSIDYIEDCVSETKTYRDGFTYEEFKDWFGTLPTTAVESIAEFISEPSQLEYKYKVTCPTCKNKKTLEFKGLSDFFG